MPDTTRLDEVLSGCAAGAMPARMAAWHRLMEAQSPEVARAALVRTLKLSAAPGADRLSATTLEIVSMLSEWRVLGLDRAVLDVGCGIGRLVAALSSLSAAVIGLDISPGMISQARARCAGFPNVSLRLGSGHDLASIAADSIDLVVLIDTFPYVLLSEGELADRYLAEIGRVLREGGDVAILNFSYRDDVAADCRELERLAAPHGLSLVRVLERPCASWDAPAYHLVKRACAATGHRFAPGGLGWSAQLRS